MKKMMNTFLKKNLSNKFEYYTSFGLQSINFRFLGLKKDLGLFKSFSTDKGGVNENNHTDKSEKFFKKDPHKFQFYKKIKPFFGKPADFQPLPLNKKMITPEETGLKYLKVDVHDPYQMAIYYNHPLERKPVSSFYTKRVNGVTYHVFNAARFPVGRILNYAAYYMQGKNSPLYRRNKVQQTDIIVIVNASTPYLTGRKMRYRYFYKPSCKFFI